MGGFGTLLKGGDLKMTVFETLVLMISFGTLMVTVLSDHNKK